MLRSGFRLPAEERSVYLERIAAAVRHGLRFSDADVAAAAQATLASLLQHSAPMPTNDFDSVTRWLGLVGADAVGR